MAGQTLGSYLADAIPTLLAGFALFGPTLGLDGSTLAPGSTAFGLGDGTRSAAMSLTLALAGVAYGLDRARYHGSTRLGVGVACCAFAGVYAGLQFI
jgi:hypothetical protein